MCSGSEEGSYLRLIYFVYHYSRIESNKEEETRLRVPRCHQVVLPEFLHLVVCGV